MIKYAWDFRQSETYKYFERTIMFITYHHYVSIYNQHDYHHLQGEGTHSSASPQLSEYNPLFLLEYQLRLIKIVI